jgi:hypothetical protein
MSALTDGFNSAFSAMQSHYDRQENNERYDQSQDRQSALDIKADERYNAQVVRQSGLDDRAAKFQDIQMTNQGLQQTVNQEAVNQIPINNARKTKQYEQEQQQYNNANLQDELSYVIASKNPDLLSNFMQKNDLENTNMGVLLDPEKFKATLALGKMLDAGQTQGLSEQGNIVFSKQFDKPVGQMGRNGSKISKVKMVGLERSGEGKVKVRLAVYTEDGGMYPSYASEMRSSDPNDPTRDYSMDDLVASVSGLNSAAKMLQSSGQHQSFLQSITRKRESEKPQQNGNFKEFKEVNEFGQETTGGWVDLNSGKTVYVPKQNIPSKNGISSEETKEQLSQKIEKIKAGLTSSGIPAQDVDSIANKMVETAMSNPSMPLSKILESSKIEYYKAIEVEKTGKQNRENRQNNPNLNDSAIPRHASGGAL